MMKYQIIFLKLQNFLYKLDKLAKKKRTNWNGFFFEKLKKKTLISKIKPQRNFLGAKKVKYFFLKMESLVNTFRLKR